LIPWIKLSVVYTCIAILAWYYDYVSWWQALIIWNALTGITALEMDCASIPRYLNPNEEIDSHYPAFRRKDMHNWSKWSYYPGAATIMLPRTGLAVIQISCWSVFILIVSIGFKVGEKPLLGWRKRAIDFAYMSCCGTTLKLTGASSCKMIDADFDYSKFLGKDYLKT